MKRPFLFCPEEGTGAGVRRKTGPSGRVPPDEHDDTKLPPPQGEVKDAAGRGERPAVYLFTHSWARDLAGEGKGPGPKRSPGPCKPQ